MLRATEADARCAITGRRWLGGVWSSTDGIDDPARGAPLIAKAIVKHCGQVVQDCAARRFEGLVLAAGLFGHGFCPGPSVGHPITEVAQYRLARFQKSQWGKVAKF